MDRITNSDQPDFVDPDQIYRCITCKDVLKDPYQLVCGHHVCADHLNTMFVNNNSFTCPDQTCGFVSEHSQVFPDVSRKREITCLLVRCPYRNIGCQEIVEWRNLQKHREMCCLTTVECINKCGETSIPRGQVSDHLLKCPLNPSVCPYFDQGCTFKGTDQEVKEHEEKSVSLHLSMETSLRREREARDEKVNTELKRHMCNLVEMFVKKEEDNQDLREQLTKARAELRDMKKLMAGYREMNISMKRRMEDHVTKDVTDKLSNDVTTLRNALTTSMERVTFLERAGPVPGLTAGPTFTQLERQLDLNDSKLNKLDLEIRLMETADHTGTLMWKVSDFARRTQEAISGKTLSLYSQPFYSSRYGYRMCARVYLNGDGAGKGTHLSFFFVLMKGDFDELLHWPFKQQVTLMLLDQSGTGQDIRETFVPTPNGNSFQRPQTETNVACGVPRFCHLDRLESDMYLRNDTIFLMAKIDCKDLRVL